MQKISNELVEKFLKGLCSVEEAAAVEAYLQQHPEDPLVMDEYEATDGETPLPEGYREEMLAVIVEQTVVKPSGGRRILHTWMAAASVILLAVGCWWLLKETGRKEGAGMRRQEAAIWMGKRNTDNKKLRVQLPDSSEALLSPGATIRYRKDFGLYGKREVKIEGQAAFRVDKNNQVPFIVYSEGISTTVIGTIFEVTAEKRSDQIRVRLLEGKLLIGLDSLLNDSVRRYLLSPGEEFVYGKWNRIVVIREFNSHSGGTYATRRVNRLPGSPDSLTNWYMFNNQALSEVFDQLSILYNVDIQYSREDLHNKYFIGKLEKKDSLSKIIQDIALLNHLSVTSQRGRYIIRKRKP